MKDSRSTNSQLGKQGIDQNQKPTQDTRSNLDSRKNLEQDFKGSDVTHNKKDVRSEQKSKR